MGQAIGERDLGGPLISVIICTYNRADLLRHSLEAVCNQSLERSDYEIIVVDNNSKDNTREVVEEFCSRYPGIRYSFEGKQGLSHARNHGWHLAEGRYVAYTDDDSEVPPEWLSLAKEIITRFEPAAFGGPIRGIPGPTRQKWFKDDYLNQCSIREARFLISESEEYGQIIGMNMFFRCDLIHKVGGFDPRLGMTGDTLAYGEETAFLEAITKLPGEKMYFDPRLYVCDIKRPEKLLWTYALRAAFGAGRTSYRKRAMAKPADRESRVIYEAARLAVGMTIDFTREVIHRNRKQYPFIQNYIYECCTIQMNHLGRLFEHNCHFREYRKKISKNRSEKQNMNSA